MCSDHYAKAKTNYILGNYVGSIALCGIVAEKMAILIYRMNTPNSTKLEDFDKEYSQAKRNQSIARRKSHRR